jgi:hypothetical protein
MTKTFGHDKELDITVGHAKELDITVGHDKELDITVGHDKEFDITDLVLELSFVYHGESEVFNQFLNENQYWV